MDNIRNWAGNYKFNASELYEPETVEQVQELVARSNRIKVLGTRHSFNGIADCTESLLTLNKLNRVIELDHKRSKVTVEGGIRYGELSQYLYEHGYAVHNLASLPHITVAGACATATHGSGDRNGNLASAVHSMEVVQANGERVVFSRDQEDGLIAGAVVGLGGLGVVTQMTLDVVPAFQLSQYVFEHLPFAQLKDYFENIFASAYSVSLFTNWKTDAVNQVWIKRKISEHDSAWEQSEFWGARLASAHRHPVPGYSADNCSEQLGIPGPSHERLPHFRMDFTPSAGEELQSEYFVARQDAYHALSAIDRIRDLISPLLYVSEIRTIAADDLWMSPCYKQDSVGIHFTWRADWDAVQQVLPIIEEQLAPFYARPHWGKLFVMSPIQLQSLYERLPDFRQLLRKYDPRGKFSNAFLQNYIMEK